MRRGVRNVVGDLFRMVRILPPLVDKDGADQVDIEELAEADREGEERLERAQKNLKPLRRGEISEEEFYRRALGIRKKEGESNGTA